MAGTFVKRHREEEESDIQEFDENREAKRYKSYNTTTNNKQQAALDSFLEQEEDDVVVSSQDLSLFLTNLQQELFSDPLPCLPDPSKPDSHGSHQTLLPDTNTEDGNICSKEDDEKERVIIRHLLEASDDELGLPNEVGVDRTVSSGDEDFNGLDDDDVDKHNSSLFCDGLWELEDEAANYYTLLQSQLFM